MFKIFKALSENKQLQKQVDALEKEKQRLEQEVVSLSQELNTHRERSEIIQSNHSSAAEKLIGLEARLLQEQTAYAKLQQELANAQHSHEASLEKIESLNLQLSEASLAAETHKAPQEDHSSYLQQLEDKEQNIQKLKADLQQAQQEQLRVSLENKKLASEITELKAQQSTVVSAPSQTHHPHYQKKLPQNTQVLIVDDSLTTRTLMKKILESAHYQVRIATDGIEGKQAIESKVPDIVVTDIEMPHLDGFELTRWIKGYGPSAQIPVIMITSLADEDFQQRGHEAGASSFITKNNFHQQTFLNIIEQTLNE